MSGYATAAATARIISVHGETMTLKRTGETDLELKGKRIPGGIEESGNSAAQQAFAVKISTKELAASAWMVKAPKRKDSIVVDGKERRVLDAIPLGDAGTVAIYKLTVAG